MMKIIEINLLVLAILCLASYITCRNIEMEFEEEMKRETKPIEGNHDITKRNIGSVRYTICKLSSFPEIQRCHQKNKINLFNIQCKFVSNQTKWNVDCTGQKCTQPRGVYAGFFCCDIKCNA
uniref:Cnidarian restricted protein n=1 Tax=Clytia hemisphaerica TaxID=252671 RepID=A0A7M5UP38_9CNID